jgi:ribosomal protein L17
MRFKKTRHETRKKFNHLSRQTAHRKSMLANMACSIEHKRINTTVAKAKANNLLSL